MSKKCIFFSIGTRPEAIKLASAIHAAERNPNFKNYICVTNQHTDLLCNFLKRLDIAPDYFFKQNSYTQSLHTNLSFMLNEFEAILKKIRPVVVVVQGDTTTAFAAALSAHYLKIPVAHIEAGLRTNDLFSPWPEEAHRAMIDQLSSYLFASTEIAKSNLISCGIQKKKIWTVGNTNIDILKGYLQDPVPQKDFDNPRVLVAVHRRENHGKPLRAISQGLLDLKKRFPKIQIKVLLHPNPVVREAFLSTLGKTQGIELRNPMDQLSLFEQMKNSLFLLTDSGGLQEEAPYLGLPVLVARKTTERPEGLLAGTARLVGTSSSSILDHCTELLQDPELVRKMSKRHEPYGPGDSGDRIISALSEEML